MRERQFSVLRNPTEDGVDPDFLLRNLDKTEQNRSNPLVSG
ncbi:hypothetical protein HMPREF1508_0482 [Shuttleworthella sp. MSX8B]|uniref:Uncharacterized protein n=1 Tax=Shuttleworthella satelles DSM 14600 TaxID=626523 RepID=C4GCR5_9FIRM|nr:hypothetical protein GCWU000342_01759 [Shuttleworthia satelles DSM 14600]EUB12939.1 hypothetical protein HMPREF1508_0482 [Shuttleworthia sp. MSX8B]